MSNRILVDYYVDPTDLQNSVCIEDPVKVNFINIDLLKKKGFLGKTGLQLAEKGCTFYISRDLMLDFLEEGIIKILN